MAKITFQSVTKVFGRRRERALALLREGADKESIRAKTGNTVALDDISLEVPDGRVGVVMGLSGSGKSTLLRLVNRLIVPDSGDVRVAGQSVPGLDAKSLMSLRRKQVSMVFQGFALFPHKNVEDNTAYGLRLANMPRATARAEAHRWIERVGLGGYERAYPHELSGGMMQRVGLARALATDPEILLMDEPFSALDPLTRREMQDLLLRLQNELKKTILFVTHDLGEAIRVGHRISILKDGRLLQSASPRKILEKPANDHIRAFVGTLTGLPPASAPKKDDSAKN